MRFQPIIPLLQRTIAGNRFTHNIRLSFPSTGLPLTRIQIANFVRVTEIKRSDPKQRFAVIATHPLPSYVPRKNEQKTYDVDVLMADTFFEFEDAVADVCWRFQVLEGEDEIDRLVHYGQAFGKHGSGDEDYDEYVRAFQGKVNGHWVIRTVIKNGGKIRFIDDEDEL